MQKAPIPQSIYTEEYFRHCRHGADEFARSGGREISPIHAKILDLADPRPGRRILDVGCGCGELVIHAALRGAEAVGIDYAEAAHRIATEAAAAIVIPAPGRTRFEWRGVEDLPDERFDAVILADIVEHPMLPGAGLFYRATHSWPLLKLFFADHLFAVAE